MRNIIFLFVLAAAAAFGSGCAREIVVAEVLQQPMDARLYTRCNLWFEDPMNMSSVNYQRGRVLPIGSEITAVYASQKEFVFKDAKGVEYRIAFDPETMMIPMQEYLRRILTLTPPEELLRNVPPENLEKIKAATVAPGMSRQDVIYAFGYPVPGRTPELSNSSYLYYQSPERTFRVVFKGNEVRNVIAPQN